ncbi:MAG TPA: hypothetical protein VEG34_14300 [Thermoanaerobaculia bacterium]|nr:hypothetical protein [Thermoanaerobaculia bacterium]
MKTLYATFDGQVLRPEDPLQLPANTRVRLTIESAGEEAASAPASFLQTARAQKLDGPPDWSSRLDGYLFGEETEPHG